MRFKEFGKNNERVLVMFHASCMTWEFLEKSIRKLKDKYHVIVPVMPGYDMEDDSDYTSVEDIAEKTESYLLEKGYREIDGIYGISMGGSIVIRILANGNIKIKKAVIDAGITPYQLPEVFAKMYVIRDFSFMMMLKCSQKFASMFVSNETCDSDTFTKLRKVMEHATVRTIWNNFKSCNTYSMPEKIVQPDTEIQYWYGSKEKMNRRRDMKYVKKIFPKTRIKEIPGFNHAGFLMTKPEIFAKEIIKFLDKE